LHKGVWLRSDPLGELTALPSTPKWINGKGGEAKGGKGEGRKRGKKGERKGRGKEGERREGEGRTLSPPFRFSGYAM